MRPPLRSLCLLALTLVAGCGGKVLSPDLAPTGSTDASTPAPPATGAPLLDASPTRPPLPDAAPPPDDAATPDGGASEQDSAPSPESDADAAAPADASDDVSDAGPADGGWVDLATNANGCKDQPGVPCGWTSTNEGTGFVCGCWDGTWADPWSCMPADTTVIPGPGCDDAGN